MVAGGRVPTELITFVAIALSLSAAVTLFLDRTVNQ